MVKFCVAGRRGSRCGLIFGYCFMVLLCIVPGWGMPQSEMDAARAVMERAVPALREKPRMLALEAMEQEGGLDVFETKSEGGVLTVRGSSGVALCRGFYDFVKANGMGMTDWENSRMVWPESLPAVSARKVFSPFRYRYMFNEVTYGYSMPYWTWERWQKEIDWMALHGINMPLALVANEAIATRVWRQMGLTQAEIDEFYVGPAHLPWQRMGNIVNHDGALSDAWHADQVALQHKILERMKSLGMHPVCPAFSGFVPKGMKRVHPEVAGSLTQPVWNAGFGPSKRTHFLSPDQPLFQEIGTRFMTEWQKEFGRNTFHRADSFNEMPLPVAADDPRAKEILAKLGEEVYASLSKANPEAVWVMQGWMFGYQRNIWNHETLEALLSKVPDDRMLLLDLATDYNADFWKNGMNWDVFKGFCGKGWIYCVVPNMGGKGAMTGNLEHYANGHVKALESANRGKLLGMGMAGEGIETNGIVTELFLDAAWRDHPVPLDSLIADYCRARYGAYPDSIRDSWQSFRKTVYGSLCDHPYFNWQQAPGSRGGWAPLLNEEFLKGISRFVHTQGLEDSPLFRQDCIELTAHYLGARMAQAKKAALEALDEQDAVRARGCMKEFRRLALECDSLLERHPTWRLENWIALARSHGSTKVAQDAYEENARRIVTLWGPPVNDYAAKVWSGLIRDYYLPRFERYVEGRLEGSNPDLPSWEEAWVHSTTLSPASPVQDVVAACRAAVDRAVPLPDALTKGAAGEVVGNWSPAEISTDWKEISWPLAPGDLKRMKGVRFVYTSGDHALDIKDVEIVGDGAVIAADRHEGCAGSPSLKSMYTFDIPAEANANNGCEIRARVRGNGGSRSNGKVEMIVR
ncbi:alpha-n-acetylglucosaminidase (naglu) tim-barrel domain [Akkermansia glycaniphila]|uniref:Alpha-n-acetylglucosaminidase (Naglu) tim-barrel domain n=2 Tax=Akkermansia glycaniphila TaxID=1679444 RepID=A0A1H6KAH2_9BACT|nr:alpha-n-acetylglucosaminidase (naglu) tim-barrel domain [Akkermansia glycaniphila]